ncbi:MAG: hypothetical protein Tsb0013_08170 [Phycisphaerales bacterium]
MQVNDDVTIFNVTPPHADQRVAPGPTVAVLDPGPRPYTVTDMIAGIIAIALLEVLLGKAVASSTSAGWGVVVGLGTFLLVVSFIGLRFRSGIGRWLGARRLSRTNLELAALGDTSVTPVELCESALCLRRCTVDDASPMRRLDIDQIRELAPGPLPKVWILTEEGAPPAPGETWAPRHDPHDRRLTPCTVVRESLGRQSSTFAIIRTAVIILLAALMVVVVVMSGAHIVGCALAAVLFFIIAGLIPMRRIALVDRLMATTRDGVWLVLDERALKRRELIITKRAKDLGIEPHELPADDRIVKQLPRPEIRVPWTACYVLLYRPKVTNTDERPQPGGAWRWRIYPPREYWDALGVGGTYAIEADGVEASETPWGDALAEHLPRPIGYEGA